MHVQSLSVVLKNFFSNKKIVVPRVYMSEITNVHYIPCLYTSLSVVSHLFLVPFEIWEEDKANLWVRIFINNPVSLCLLLQDVKDPLGGEWNWNKVDKLTNIQKDTLGCQWISKHRPACWNSASECRAEWWIDSPRPSPPPGSSPDAGISSHASLWLDTPLSSWSLKKTEWYVTSSFL